MPSERKKTHYNLKFSRTTKFNDEIKKKDDAKKDDN